MYSDIVQTSKKMQKSINIEFDLHNPDRINAFIPTSSSCEIIRTYMNTALGKGSDYAVTVTGPYGRGKSILLLILAEILGNPDEIVLSDLFEKIEKIDPELIEMIREYRSKDQLLLPVIINGSEDLKQAFLLGLDNALKREGLEETIPQTIFSVCLSTLEDWSSNETLLEKLDSCLEQAETTRKQLVKGLKSYSQEALERFKKVYECLSLGIPFNPLANSDPVSIYPLVLKDLNKTRYNGLFILFDEFGKVLEDQSDRLPASLKIVQDFAELANRSSEKEKIFLTCITHKSLNLYASQNESASAATFRTVEGRFNEIQMKQTPSESYQLAALSLEKVPGYKVLRDSIRHEKETFYQNLEESHLVDEYDLAFLEKETFPYNPLAVTALVSLSERVAQNERTLFTAIIDDDPASFKSFIEHHDQGLYNADLLYDYFSEQIAKEPELQNLWYRTQALLNLDLSDLEKRVLKAIAITLIVAEKTALEPKEKTFALLLDESTDDVFEVLKNLCWSGYLRENPITQTWSFTSNASREIDMALQSVMGKCIPADKLDNAVSEILGENYIPAYRYNLEYKMTRYFGMKTVLADSLMLDQKFFPAEGEDGLVVTVLMTPSQKESVEDKIRAFNTSENIVFRLTEVSQKRFLDELKRLASLHLIDRKELSEVGNSELDLMIEELGRNLKIVLNKVLNESVAIRFENGEMVRFKGSQAALSNGVSMICREIYPGTPVINNEMINRHKPASGYEKPLGRVNSEILNRDIDRFIDTVSITSPERSVYRALYESPNPEKLDSVLTEIKNFLLSSEGQTVSLSGIIEPLKVSPYGIREGILPSLFAMAFSNLEQHPILYFQNRQIQTSNANLKKAVLNPESYYVQLSKNTAELEKYLTQVLEELKEEPSQSFYTNLDLAARAIRKKINRMPALIRESSTAANPLGLSAQFLSLKKKIVHSDVNTYSFFAEFVPELIQKNFEECPAFFRTLDKEEKKINQYRQSLIQLIANTFGGSENSSIKSSYGHFLSEKGIDPERIVLEGVNQQVKVMLAQAGFDDSEVLNNLSHLITGYEIEDWSMDRKEDLLSAIEDFKESLMASEVTIDGKTGLLSEEIQSESYSMFGEMLKDSIQSSISEFGESVTNEEKLMILQALMAEISGVGK